MKRCVLALLIVLALPSAAQAQVTVYSSLPLSGASRVSTKAVNDGARLALKESGISAISFKTLNSATKQAGSWTPGRTNANARKAAKDAQTLAYIGEFNSGASKVSIPILSAAGIPQISPSNTFNGLTEQGVQTFFRLLPTDHVQAAALVTAMRDRGCTRLGFAYDNTPYGKEMNVDVVATAQRLGLQIAASKRISKSAPKQLKRADCVAYTGITANGAVAFFKNKALKGKKLFGSDGVAEYGLTSRLPRSVARRMLLTVATLTSDNYGFSSYKDPYYAFGYESMKLIVDGFAAGATNRAALVAWLHTVNNRASKIGTYSFDAKGDTTLRTYGLYSVSGKALKFAGAVTAA